MTIKNRLLLFLKGMAMGVSDLIPGISGGTVALLLGIYKELIKSLKSINKETFFYFSTFNFNKLSHHGMAILQVAINPLLRNVVEL